MGLTPMTSNRFCLPQQLGVSRRVFVMTCASSEVLAWGRIMQSHAALAMRGSSGTTASAFGESSRARFNRPGIPSMLMAGNISTRPSGPRTKIRGWRGPPALARTSANVPIADPLNFRDGSGNGRANQSPGRSANRPKRI